MFLLLGASLCASRTAEAKAPGPTSPQAVLALLVEDGVALLCSILSNANSLWRP